MAPTDSVRCVLNACDLLADLAGCLRGLLRQRLDLGGHDCKAAASLARARRFDRGVERQKVGLPRDGIDQFDDVTDARRRFRQFAYAVIGPARLIDGIIGDAGGLLHLAADLGHR